MENRIYRVVMFLSLVPVAMAAGAVPPMNVSVSDSGGKAADEGAVDAKGAFATSTLKPGNYVVQFSSNKAPKGATYAFVVSAGKTKVTANSIAAETLAGGGG